jgi:hypothetical protein
MTFSNQIIVRTVHRQITSEMCSVRFFQCYNSALADHFRVRTVHRQICSVSELCTVRFLSFITVHCQICSVSEQFTVRSVKLSLFRTEVFRDSLPGRLSLMEETMTSVLKPCNMYTAVAIAACDVCISGVMC